LKELAWANIELTSAWGTEAPPPMKTRHPGRTIFGQFLSSSGFIAVILTNPRGTANQKLRQRKRRTPHGCPPLEIPNVPDNSGLIS
jgi:hypothetical protein